MQRKDSFIMTHEELFMDGPKQIAIVVDGLTKGEMKTAKAFLKQLEANGKIKPLGVNIPEKNFTVGYVLHDDLRLYTCEVDGKSAGTAVEMLRMLLIEEVWVFDVGYGNYPIDGRLDTKIKDLGLPVRFLSRTQDNTSWDFYRGREVYINENDELVEDYYFIGEFEDCRQEENEADTNNFLFRRPFSKDSMTDREYLITKRAFELTYKASSLRMLGEIRLDKELSEYASHKIGECNKIFFGMLHAEKLTDANLDYYELQLDEIELSLNSCKY